MKIKAIALDDEALALKIIEHYAAQMPDLILEKTFTKVSEAKKFLAEYPVDLIFLDIEMPAKSGMELSRELPPETKIIFTTAYEEYAAKAFEVSAADYLVKPFSFERFQEAVRKVTPTGSAIRHLSVRADYRLHRIGFDDIFLVESLDDYVKFHQRDGSVITARASLKAVQEKLPPEEFMRVHRSYILPLREIKSFTNRNIKVGDFVIPIGDTYWDSVKIILRGF